MPHLRMLWGLAFLLSANTGDGAGGGAGTGAPPPGAGAPPPPAPAAGPDPEKIKAEARAAARAEFLKEQGFEDETAYKKHLDDKKKAEDAKLSEHERSQKALAEALNNHKATESKLEALKDELKTERAERALEKLFYAQGVRPEAQTVARALYDAEKKADPKAEDKAIFEKIRKDWPNVFGASTQPLATTSPNTPAAGANGAPPANGLTFDASKLSDAEWSKWRQENNV